MKNILLTGGTGLVGSDILDVLLKSNYHVYATTRREQITKNKHLTWIKTDLKSKTLSFLNSMPRIDCVIHAAAQVNFFSPQSEFKDALEINMKFSETLFSWCLEQKNKLTVIYISSLSFLKQPLEKFIKEDNPIVPLTPYSISKYWSEQILFKYADLGGFRPVSLRLSSPISQNFRLLHNNVVKKWIESAQKGEKIQIFGKGKREQDFVATRDIAEAILRVISCTKISGIYNIASGNSISMMKLASLISKKIKTEIVSLGSDPKEKEKWKISILKAKKDFCYNPKFTSKTIIEKLLNNL